jgi:hypothetical protein
MVLRRKAKLLGFVLLVAVPMVALVIGFRDKWSGDEQGKRDADLLQGDLPSGGGRTGEGRHSPGVRTASKKEVEKLIRGNNRKKIEEFKSAGISSARKREILSELLGSPGDLDELWALIDGLPDGDKSMWFAKLAGRCATESPDKFFEIFDKLPPGANRMLVTQAGLGALDFPDLERLIETIRTSGSSEEIEDLAQSLRFVENPKLRSTDLLGYLPKLKEGELRDSIAYGAGVLDAAESTNYDLAQLRTDIGNDAADRYTEGLLSNLISDDPDRFVSLINGANIGRETRAGLIQGFASQIISEGGSVALEFGKKLTEKDTDAYYSELGRVLSTRDVIDFATVLNQMPDGRSKDLMTVQLVKYLSSKGDKEAAKQWGESIGDQSLLKQASSKK